jgi:endonuclease/exonuclease/phosphatase family metal-dependent hydrolase
MKSVFKFLLFFAGIICLLLAGIILLASVKNFNPPEHSIVYSDTTGVPASIPDDTFDVMIWNIGYCGLNAEMDFFYDGGQMVRPAKEQSLANLQGVTEFLTRNDSIEFILLQEVDVNSRRSYHVNQNEMFDQEMRDHQSFTGINYQVPYVPLPLKEPMGKVKSGLQTLSAYPPVSSVRWSFPGNFSWPMSLFMLDRCFLVNRYPVPGGELLVINTHNSAYDDGSLRIEQMHYLREFILNEYQKGNYVLVGGDWNQCPPGIETHIEGYRFDTTSFIEIPGNFLPAGWKWVWDENVPTNRRVGTPYDKNTSLTTIIDYFLLSPNLEYKGIKTHNMEFVFSDHQPVLLTLVIPGPEGSGNTDP